AAQRSHRIRGTGPNRAPASDRNVPAWTSSTDVPPPSSRRQSTASFIATASLALRDRERRQVECSTRDQLERALLDTAHASRLRLALLVGQELATQREVLPLIARADCRAVRLVRWLEHPLEGQLAQALSVFERERHVVGANFEHGGRPAPVAAVDVPEARVEEPGVVGAKLAARRVVGGHLRRIARR